MKARKIHDLDPDGSFAENVRKIIDVRTEELHSFSPAVLDPRNVEDLHDMRIAAKRLRYILELTSPVFGEDAVRASKRTKALQDLLGEIHDCDVTIPRVEHHIERLRREDATALRAQVSSRAKDLAPAAARDAPNRLLYRGLESLIVYLRGRREVLYARFVRDWEREPLTVTLGAEEEAPE